MFKIMVVKRFYVHDNGYYALGGGAEHLDSRKALFFNSLCDAAAIRRHQAAIAETDSDPDLRKMDIRSVPGTALANDATGDAIGDVVYTPPEGQSRLRDLMANWERYLHESADTDPLIRMAVAHYQFEAIHPFTDGNGRTGRVLNLLFLVERELLKLPVLYLSGHLIRHKADYYRLLLKVTTEQAWEEWNLFMLRAVEETARWTTARLKAIRELLDSTAETIRRAAPKIYSRELAELLFVQPYCRIGNLVDAAIAQRQSASVYLKKLCEIGILEERKAGREKLFVNPRFLRLLTGAGPR